MQKIIRISVFSIMMMVFVSSTFANSDFNLNSPKIVNNQNSLFAGCLKNFQTNWTNWQAMNDGKNNGVDIRWRRGSFKYEGGNYEVFWQLRNRYQSNVRISFKLNYTKADGSPYTTSEVIEIDAGDIADSIGQASIAYSLSSYQVTRVEFLDE